MNRYLFLYFGGSEPTAPEEIEATMDAWTAYFDKLGDKIIDGGAPLADRTSVGGSVMSQATGYSIIIAADLDEARTLSDGHPHLITGGTIEILECVDMDMGGEEDEEDDEDEDEMVREAVI
ncbi:hypothetical protein [Asticcacaulis sp. AC402]|uniref:hypothetical protein n=1 Tax=Asticcacaulis sp. AC402 TaxID=1282361 RepID=UPI0003C3B018|nr:hypothetical protein [Asticcacaulis sp. AC402]ESQ75962.1 hypothetical protein ABAC402_05830 [Asticcacaulis sp. AC402]